MSDDGLASTTAEMGKYGTTGRVGLTHLPLDKMAAILEDDIFRCISVNEFCKFCILIKISLKFVAKGLIDNKHYWFR